ncbi:alpha/beta fold hydrolase [Paraburkholderia sp. 40]|uniref:alpha/beta fold hydrolase n=1 Tax=Paraburkholderia sp. 40 TaxID=2991059 RepID=UPI003D1E55F8
MTTPAACTPSTKRPPVPATPDNAASQPEPYFREAGVGPAVVCLHSNASTSGQWRALIDRLLAPQFHLFAPDSYGAGKSPQWSSGTGSLAFAMKWNSLSRFSPEPVHRWR